MWKKFAVVGSVVAVAGLGIGGVATTFSGAPAAQAAAPSAVSSGPSAGGALSNAIGAVVTAAANTDPTTSTPASKPADKQKKHKGLAKRLSRASHATWVTKDKKTGTFVTHDAVRGAVSAVASGSVTIKATDGTSETFVVTGSTKVRVNGTTGAISQVKVGDRVAVVGTGSGPMTATRVVDRGAPGTKPTPKQGSKAKPTAPTATSATPTTPTPTAPTS